MRLRFPEGQFLKKPRFITGVGSTVARNLHRHFGSIEKVMTAPEEVLQEVALVGPRIAERIREQVGVGVREIGA
jgi:ERCC4-type nuclease